MVGGWKVGGGGWKECFWEEIGGGGWVARFWKEGGMFGLFEGGGGGVF